jgi:CheY-like chemotaxis protein
MGGKISVNSLKNIGTEFTIDVDLGLTPEKVSLEKLKGHLLPLHTLIVDDDVVVCQHTQMTLNEAGLLSEWVDSGEGAIGKVTDAHKNKKDFDLILLDWKMPDMDGIETAKGIRKIVGPDVTIIIMTAYDWTDIEKEAKAAGIDYFVRKPLFVSSIKRAFEQVFLEKKNPEAALTPPKDFDFSNQRILVAEDNAINAEIAIALLTSKHAEVVLAHNGKEALDLFEASSLHHFQAILMDVRMPLMDGLEASKAIRSLPREDAKFIPIIAMTANAFQEDINQSLQAGMSAHLAKPIEPVLLYQTLAKFLFSKQ